MNYSIEGISEQGTKTSQNQDACFAGTTITAAGEVVFVVLCDGMGGTDAGELASATLVEEFQKWFYCKCDLGQQWVPDTYHVHLEWKNLLENCNKKILNYGIDNCLSLGSTIALGLVTESDTVVMNVGDSRIYAINEGMKRLNRDHSVVGDEIEDGILTEEEAKKDSRNNQLTQCVGMIEELTPFFAEYPTEKGTYLFCSDGFYNSISNKDISRYIGAAFAGEKSLKAAVRELVDNARQNGEKDDISVVAVSIKAE